MLKNWSLLVRLCFCFKVLDVQANVHLVENIRHAQSNNKVAILVGVERYPKFRPLTYAVDDVHGLAEVLHKQGYQVKTLTEGNANKNLILDTIKNTAPTLRQPNSTLVFFFSGHGQRINSKNYLATFDALPKNLANTGLAVQTVIDTIENSGIERAVLFLDACRDEPVVGQKGGQAESFANTDFGKGIRILYSTSQNYYSWEDQRLRHGVFSYFLIRGLSGHAQQNNVVTFSSLTQYVQNEVPKWVFQHLNEAQQPVDAIKGETYGNFVLSQLGGVKPANPSLPLSRTIVQPSPVIQPQRPVQSILVPVPANNTNTTRLIAGRYIDNGDGTITDTQTKLMWKKCSEGQSGVNCELGTIKKYTWQDAMNQLGKDVSFNNYNDWRMPTKDELKTLVYCSNGIPQQEAWRFSCRGQGKFSKAGEYQRPTTNLFAFPKTADAAYWSSSTTSNSNNAWAVYFNRGVNGAWDNKDNRFQTRLVRR